jgi:hypothetical protein
MLVSGFDILFFSVAFVFFTNDRLCGLRIEG